MRVIHCSLSSPIVYTGLMVGVGTRDEQPSMNGMAHYIEHCVFKGTEQYSARRILNLTEQIGGEVNAYTTKEETTFYAATLVENFSKAVKLLSQLVLYPTFPKAETDKELGVILDEIETYNDSPSELIYDDYESLLFAPHSLGLPILGTKRSLRHLTRQNVIEFMQRNYSPERMVFFCLGNVSFKKVISVAERYLSDYSVGGSALPRLQPEISVAKQLMMRKRTHQTHVMLGASAPAIGEEHQAAAYLICNIIGGTSSNSMLNLSLREQKGLVYTIDANYSALSDCGYWSVYFAADDKDTSQCMELVKKTLSRLREKPLTEQSLRRYKHQLKTQMAIAAENNENTALAMAKNMLYLGRGLTWQENYAKLEAVTVADLQRLACEMFAEENINTLMYC